MVLMLPDPVADRPGYWQRHWAASRMDCAMLDLGSLVSPNRNSLVSKLDRAIHATDAPLVLVGHGLGALTIAWWASLMSGEDAPGIVAALLVAPTDPDATDALDDMRALSPLPSAVLPFPALVVASDEDPAFSIARQWGAGFARFDGCGDFGIREGLGFWPEGEELLDRFIDLVGDRQPGTHMPMTEWRLPVPNDGPALLRR
jgi:predicted alpha/beta hydrolase family esterase